MNLMARSAVWTLAVLLVMAPIVAVLNGWFAAERWPLKKLSLSGEFQQVSDAELRTALLPYAATGFFAVDLDRVRTAVEALPWVASAEVRKQWPDTLLIRVVERKAVAHWGSDRLLAADGDLFDAPQTGLPEGLPWLAGPDARVSEVVGVYQRANQWLLPASLRVTGVQLDARGSWTLRLAGGAEVIVGRGNPDARLSRFARAIGRVIRNAPAALQRADLRYSTGFAVTWASPEPAASAQAAEVALACPSPESRVPNPGLTAPSSPNHESPITNHGSKT